MPCHRIRQDPPDPVGKQLSQTTTVPNGVDVPKRLCPGSPALATSAGTESDGGFSLFGRPVNKTKLLTGHCLLEWQHQNPTSTVKTT